MKTRIATLISTLALSLTLCATAQASSVTFDLSQGVDHPTFTQTVSGVTLILSNSSPAPTFTFNSLYSGLDITPLSTLSFNLTVTGATLKFISYEIDGAVCSTDSTFSMSGGSGTTSGLNTLDSAGAYSFNGNWTLAPGQTGTLNATLGVPVGVLPGQEDYIFSTIKTMTFEATSTVPEPSTYALLCISLGVVGYAHKRMAKRAAVAAVVA